MDFFSYAFLLGIVLSIYIYCRRSHKWNMTSNLRVLFSMLWGFLAAIPVCGLLFVICGMFFSLLLIFFPELFHC